MKVNKKQALKEYLYPLVLALAIGAIAGLGAVFFRELIDLFQALFWGKGRGDLLEKIEQVDPVVRVIIPSLVGLAIGPVVTFWAPEVRGPGVPEVMEALALKGARIRHRVTAIKSLVTAALIASGASVGREGPIVQIGSSIGSSLTQLFRLGSESRRLAVACGAAAGIAATFQAPMAGTLFAVEILLFDLEVVFLSNIVVSAVTGTVISKQFFGEGRVFDVPSFYLGSPIELLLYFALGIAAGFVAIGVMGAIFTLPRLWKRIKMPLWLTPSLGGLGVGLLGLLLPYVLGVGYSSIDMALAGKVSIQFACLLLLGKLVATGVCIGSGMSGGIFAPSLFLGSMLGSVVGLTAQAIWPEAGIVPAHYALVGMGAMVSGTTLAPVTAVLTIFELTYTYQIILPLMVACIGSLLVVRLLHGYSAYETKLLQKGVNIVRGREINVLRNMRIEDYMDTDLQILRAHTRLPEIIERMEQSPFPHFVVLNEKDELMGVLTLRDLRPHLAHPERYNLDITAKDIMKGEVITLTRDDSMERAFSLFAKHQFSFLPVVEGEGSKKVIGQLKRSTVFSAYEEEVLKGRMLSQPNWLCQFPARAGSEDQDRS